MMKLAVSLSAIAILWCAPAQAEIGECYLAVDGHTVIDGACEYNVGGDAVLTLQSNDSDAITWILKDVSAGIVFRGRQIHRSLVFHAQFWRSRLREKSVRGHTYGRLLGQRPRPHLHLVTPTV
jgi:hypothetical protein